MKTLLINIQVDDIKLSDLELVSDLIDEALEEFKRKRISIQVQDTFGPPLPVPENQ